MLRPFTYDALLCPDDEPATFYAVYREGISETAPIVVVFHADAFDYVAAPDALYPLEGDHYAGTNQLTAEWAADKVFETFGLLPGQAASTSEVNTGAIPAALAEVGAFAIYPANCWGDLWHNEDGYEPNDVAADGGIHRQGRFLAWMMTRFASTDTAVAAEWRGRFGLDELPVPIASGEVSFVGLGDGGRAVVEQLRRAEETADVDFPVVRGVILDSTMDNLFPIVADPAAYAGVPEGLERLYPGETDIGRFSLARWIPEQDATGGLDFPVDVWWSSQDPRVPNETVAGLVAIDPTYELLTTTDTQAAVHVNLNNDLMAARNAVNELLGD